MVLVDFGPNGNEKELRSDWTEKMIYFHLKSRSCTAQKTLGSSRSVRATKRITTTGENNQREILLAKMIYFHLKSRCCTARKTLRSSRFVRGPKRITTTVTISSTTPSSTTPPCTFCSFSLFLPFCHLNNMCMFFWGSAMGRFGLIGSAFIGVCA